MIQSLMSLFARGLVNVFFLYWHDNIDFPFTFGQISFEIKQQIDLFVGKYIPLCHWAYKMDNLELG